MYFLGYDIGSSSVKVCLMEADSGAIIASDFYPKNEMAIIAHQIGWAEQNPQDWWENLQKAHHSVIQQANIPNHLIKAIGITWQMHGLVLVDQQHNILRPSIIWCDSRAVDYGNDAFMQMGEDYCLTHLLNSPGNFTVAKLAWVKEHEPEIFEKIAKIMLPGDYIAMKLTNEVSTTIEGLSEGIFWDFKEHKISQKVLDCFGFSANILPKIVPTLGIQGLLSKEAAELLNLAENTPITYRAGDQPNNAFALNVMNPGDIAANAGTSGVVYGVTDIIQCDPQSRINIFAHINHSEKLTRLGALLCINGTGILNSWMRKNFCHNLNYPQINELAASSPIGAKGISIIPFGNGAERILNNQDANCSFHGINFNFHDQADILRATQEGIVFAFQYGLEIMQAMGISVDVIKAGYTNMFLSPIFSQTLANISQATIELYNADGAFGAAKGAGLGLQYYKSPEDTFELTKKITQIEPENHEQYQATCEAYKKWQSFLK